MSKGARINQAAKRQRGDSLAWCAGFDKECARTRHEAPLTISLDDADAGPRLRLAAEGAGWITVHDGFDTSARVRPGQSVKCWPIEHWSKLVHCLKAERPAVRIVQIGGTSSRAIPGVDECLIGRIRFGEALWLLQGAQLHIDGESGLVHAAHALGTRSVVLFGPTDPAFFGYAGNINLSSDVCAPCWWSTPDWMTHCPRGLPQPACMSAITPASVKDAALACLDQGARRPHSALQLMSSAVWSSTPSAGAELVCAIKEFTELVDGADGHSRSPTTGCHLHATKHWEYAFALDAIGITARDGACRPMRIADLGCGRGALGPWLAAQGHAVIGYDRDFAWDGNTDAAQRFLGWNHNDGFAPRAATLYAIPEPDGQGDEGFDAVLMISVLQHLTHPALALREAARILKPGGLLVLSFDLAEVPERFEDPHLRRSIACPARLATWLGLEESSLGLAAAAIRQASAELQAARVAGIPEGLTVGALCLLKNA
jgi:SAM-dependent methyltransferase